MSDTARLADLAISPNGFVFDPMTGASFTVNAVGMALIEGLKEGLHHQALVDRLRDRFEMPADGADIDRDVEDFVDQLRRSGLVPRDFHV